MELLQQRSTQQQWTKLRGRGHLLAAAFVALALAAPAQAIPVAPGYYVSEIAQTQSASGSVLYVAGSLFYGEGPFGVGGQSIVRLDPGGSRTVVATGFNSISGLIYDAANDRLIVGDNGGDVPGAVTGDTLFGVDTPFVAPAGPPTAARSCCPASVRR